MSNYSPPEPRPPKVDCDSVPLTFDVVMEPTSVQAASRILRTLRVPLSDSCSCTWAHPWGAAVNSTRTAIKQQSSRRIGVRSMGEFSQSALETRGIHR